MPIHPGFGQVYLGKPNGIPYQVVNGSQLEVSQLQLGYYGSNDASPPPGAVPVPVNFSDWSESDAGPYPLRADTPIEGCFPNETLTCSAGGDRHAIVLDASTCTLYELFGARAQQEETKKLVTPSSTAAAARWRGVSGAIFPMSWSGARRADGRQQCWTSADAAGLPILPGLVTYDEVQEAIAENRGIQHAVRFTAAVSQAAFVPPASHYASPHTNSTLAPMGARFRLRQDYDCGSMPPQAKAVCLGMQSYGVFLADNGMNWMIAGAPDDRWEDSDLGELKRIQGAHMEAVFSGHVVRGACE